MSDTTIAEAPSSAPHTQRTPAGEWLKKNLFNSVGNSIVTVVIGAILAYLAFQVVRWIVGIDFTIIRDTLRIFMIGQFPDEELWRLWVSGFLLMSAIGLAGGTLSRQSYETALAQDVEPDVSGPVDLVRRFWPIMAVLIFFALFAKTVSPMIAVLIGIVLAFIFRQIAWMAPAWFRQRGMFVVALLVIASMLVVAGTSGLGGIAVGLVVLFWVLAELGRRDAAATTSGRLVNYAVAAVAAIAAAVAVWLIPFDGFGWDDWGGLHINLFTAVVGITLGMPFGILLALGRRSDLPVIKTASVLYIEFVRGVPLISLLLFSKLLLPFFLPIDLERPAALTLAIIVIMGFSAAYIAEIVRGGLQAVAKGQTEAGQALGLSPGTLQRKIVLPQALRAVIPAMVGQFIALFKDTTLLAVASILEFLDAAKIANNQPQFLGKGLAPVTYLFVAIGFWAFSFTMSKESRRLERRLNVGHR